MVPRIIRPLQKQGAFFYAKSGREMGIRIFYNPYMYVQRDLHGQLKMKKEIIGQ
ncbi:MAG: hypothetical protein RHS_2126 [Robinsoniella sp. RHS]|nr:MAG: hypothetical protein RHS_2126 [Robinsoniella sp. RHS]